jgi:hypothetical protein
VHARSPQKHSFWLDAPNSIDLWVVVKETKQGFHGVAPIAPHRRETIRDFLGGVSASPEGLASIENGSSAGLVDRGIFKAR